MTAQQQGLSFECSLNEIVEERLARAGLSFIVTGESSKPEARRSEVSHAKATVVGRRFHLGHGAVDLSMHALRYLPLLVSPSGLPVLVLAVASTEKAQVANNRRAFGQIELLRGLCYWPVGTDSGTG